MQNTVTVKSMQSLFDLAIQSSGSVEAIFDLAIKSDLSLTDRLIVGSKLDAVNAVSLEVLDYYNTNKILPATETTGSLAERLQGIGYWAIGIDFIVS